MELMLLAVLPFLIILVPLFVWNRVEAIRERLFNREFGGYDSGISYMLMPTYLLDPRKELA